MAQTKLTDFKKLQTAHRQLQATIDRLGNENAKLRAMVKKLGGDPDGPQD